CRIEDRPLIRPRQPRASLAWIAPKGMGSPMTSEGSARVHPTAVLSGDVQLGKNVEIGAYAVLEGEIRLGDYCVIRPGAYLFGPLTMGRGNVIHTGAVLGDVPQHLKYKGERT